MNGMFLDLSTKHDTCGHCVGTLILPGTNTISTCLVVCRLLAVLMVINKIDMWRFVGDTTELLRPGWW